ncbi:hypothetical protein HY405_01140 [Candidatus Microgenomates bacterium]|nr:hypothetical protein [Candidatus Microgenomates bacterium]
MNTALATQQTSVGEQSLILPNKREALLMKLNEFKVNNLSAKDKADHDKDKADHDMLVKKTSNIFVHLCWSKLGVSTEQLKKLGQQDLNELAAIIYEESRLFGLIQSGILTCIPVIGWAILMVSLKGVDEAPEDASSCYRNMRYYWWCKRMKNKYNLNFQPNLSLVSK